MYFYILDDFHSISQKKFSILLQAEKKTHLTETIKLYWSFLQFQNGKHRYNAKIIDKIEKQYLHVVCC